MSDLTIRENDLLEQTPEVANVLHQRIVTAGAQAALNFVEMCRLIKIMRDQNMYKQLGHETFDEYCENQLGVKARQGYNYITIYERLPKEFLQSNANLGVTKLELLSHIPAYDVEEFVEENQVTPETSVAELKAQIEEYKKQTEQLNLFKAENEELKKQIEAVPYAPERYITPEELEEEKQKAVKEALKEQKEKQKEKIEKETQKELDKKEEELRREIEERVEKKYREDIDSLNAAIQKSDERAISLEKQLKMADSSVAKFKVYFDAVQNDYSSMIRQLNEIEPETKSKLKFAVKQLIENMQKSIKEEER